MKPLWLYTLVSLSGLGMAFCQYLIYCYAPIESELGIIQKIFYLHLPLAWWALISFFIVCIASIGYLKTRKTYWDALSGATAEIGVILSSATIITGSIWGKQSWGVWWTWDPRLTTALVLWFLYSAYLVLRQLDIPQERRSLLCSVLGIIAFLDVPLVFLSARIWRSIHPTIFASNNGGLDSEMKLTLIACIICFGFFWLCIISIRGKQYIQKERLAALTSTQIWKGK